MGLEEGFDGRRGRPNLADVMDVQTVQSGEYTFQCFGPVGASLEAEVWAIKRIRTWTNDDGITVIRERWRKRRGDTVVWPGSFFCFRADDWNNQPDTEYVAIDPAD